MMVQPLNLQEKKNYNILEPSNKKLSINIYTESKTKISIGYIWKFLDYDQESTTYLVFTN